MKVLIAYTTKSGTTEECAQILKKKLEKKGIIADVYEMKAGEPAPRNYDVIVCGSYVRMGKLPRELSVYLENNKEILPKKRTAYFICGAFPNKLDEVVRMSIPEDLLTSCICVACFGGRLQYQKLKGMDKLMVKSMRNIIRGYHMEEPDIMEENIDQFVEALAANIDKA